MGDSIFRSADSVSELSARARRLRNALEPLASNVYFAPEVHAEFEALGFGPGTSDPGSLTDPPRSLARGLARLTLAEVSGYYCSRAGCMGQVPGEVVVAAFGVFSPDLIIPAVERGWSIAGVDDVLAARERGATASLENILGTPPELGRVTEILQRAAAAGSAGGRFLYAGLRSLGIPATPWGQAWRAIDTVREHRGDSHIAAWLAAGLDPVEAGLLTEVYYEMPSKRYHRGRGWTESQLDAGLRRLGDAGLIAGDPPALTDAGRAFREDIEVATDRQQRPILDAIGDDLEELLATIEPWAGAIIAAAGFPSSIEQLPASWGRVYDPADNGSPA